ncbi:hypothetical protein ACL7TT_20240 [Microbulbifer sp. 2304DJ12-6]|uniref:hypothetical protein n=1 Tax=Microbulbifer sp. 2304DJ12-6 TaxID=3233340 RepID=UPI0039AEF3ED
MNTNQNAEEKMITKKRMEVLGAYYDVRGDGIAHAKIKQLASSQDFRASVEQLANAQLTHKD